MLSINNNLAAIASHNDLNSANNLMTKSISRLSSGLRINSSADDPSGLSISERMRTQIRGITRAEENAQSAVSLIQTAEGALNEVHGILHRMRELAIQSSNGTLTADDRLEVQHEVESLITEVDAIATRTEFNTKRLLTGEASALWSASSPDIKGIVRGQVDDGSYSLEIHSKPGIPEIQQTSVFRIKDGVNGIRELDLNGTPSQMAGDITAVGNGTVDLTFDFGNGDVDFLFTTTGGGAVANAQQIVDAINSDTRLNSQVIANHDGAGNVLLSSRNEGVNGNGFTTTINGGTGINAADVGPRTYSGGTESTAGISGLANTNGLITSTDDNVVYTINVDEAADGTLQTGAADVYGLVGQYSKDGSIPITGIGILGAAATDAFTTNSNSATGGYAIVEFTSDGTVGAAGLDARVSFDQGDTWYSADEIWNGATDTSVTDGEFTLEFNAAFTNGGVAANYQTGDRLLIALNDNDNTAGRDLTRVDSFDPSNNLTQTGAVFSHTDGTLDDATTSLQAAWMDTSNGHIQFGTVDATFNESVTGQPIADGTVTFNVVNGGGDASSHSRLIDIDRFYDVDGNFVLGDHGKYVTIYNGVGDSANILLDPLDTLEIVSQKIQDAVIKDKADGGLGMSSSNVLVDEHICDYIDTPTPGTIEHQQGSLVIRSPKTDRDGRLFFASSEDVLNALGLSIVQESENNEMDITVREAITGELIGSSTVSDNRLKGVIPGMDIEFDANYNLNVEWNTATRKFDFTATDEVTVETINIVDNSMDFQIGPNEGQMMNAFISQMDAFALGVNKVQLTDPDTAQESIRMLDEAIDFVSSERAKIGAYANRLEYTMANLAAQRENITAAESRIRDLDVAKETTALSKSQILSQTATAMLAQANQQAQGLMSLLK